MGKKSIRPYFRDFRPGALVKRPGITFPLGCSARQRYIIQKTCLATAPQSIYTFDARNSSSHWSDASMHGEPPLAFSACFTGSRNEKSHAWDCPTVPGVRSLLQYWSNYVLLLHTFCDFLSVTFSYMSFGVHLKNLYSVFLNYLSLCSHLSLLSASQLIGFPNYPSTSSFIDARQKQSFKF